MTVLEMAAVKWIAANAEKEEAEAVIRRERVNPSGPDDPPCLISTGDPGRVLYMSWCGDIRVVHVEGAT